MLLRPIGLLTRVVVASISVLFGCLRPAQSEEPGLEADNCYRTRDAVLAAFGNGQVVTVEGQITTERSGGVETFEILSRPGDNAAVLLNSHDAGVACILVQGRNPRPSAPRTRTDSEFGSSAKPAASPPRSAPR